MTEDEKIMIEALTSICKLAKSWEGRREAPYWNLGDIAAAALIKVAQESEHSVKVRCAPGQCDFSNSLECPKCGNLLF